MRWLVPLMLLLSCRAEALTEVTNFGSNPGSLKMFVYVPASLPANPALVVAMHGCSQTAEDYTDVGWNTLADERGFIVLYPQMNANLGCLHWFDSSQQSASGNEVTSILQMVTKLESTNGVDASRVYVSGLSSGAAFANVLLAVAPDVFTRGQVLAGVPFKCASDSFSGYSCMSSPPSKTASQWAALVPTSSSKPRVQLWHGTSDNTVNVGNVDEELKQWAGVNGIDTTADATSTTGPATRQAFNDSAGVTLVEVWKVSNMGHGAPIDAAHGCGSTAAYILNVGVCSAEIGARFFGLFDEVDAGTTFDAGTEVDAGSEDAGHIETPDAGQVTPDAGALLPDAGSPDSEHPPQGCGCSSGPSVLLLGLLALARRRLHGGR